MLPVAMHLGLSVDAQVLELQVNHLDLLIGQRKSLSVGQVLDHLQLVEQVRVSCEMIDVNRIQVLVKDAIIKVWMTDVRWLQVKDGAANLEQISLDLVWTT